MPSTTILAYHCNYLSFYNYSFQAHSPILDVYIWYIPTYLQQIQKNISHRKKRFWTAAWRQFFLSMKWRDIDRYINVLKSNVGWCRLEIIQRKNCRYMKIKRNDIEASMGVAFIWLLVCKCFHYRRYWYSHSKIIMRRQLDFSLEYLKFGAKWKNNSWNETE